MWRKKRDPDELKELINARLEAAKEEGKTLTAKDIIKEFGLSDQEVLELVTTGGSQDPYVEVFNSYNTSYEK